ncbi:transporter [Nostoc sp. CHAB 5834]|nr:transporter [Nostoc sp. CHAB 5834]
MPRLKQGQVQVGIGVGAGWGDDVGGFLRATPYTQYFLRDGWALRLEGRYNYNGPDGNQYAGAGLLTQYHFLRAKRLSVFGQAGYFYGKADYNRYDFIEEAPASYRLVSYREQFRYGMFNVGIGAQYQLGSRWSINALAEKNIGRKIDRFGADGYNTTIGIGFRIK